MQPALPDPDMDALRLEYEKTAWHRMGIPMERALAKVSWLRVVLESGARRTRQRTSTKPARAAGAR